MGKTASGVLYESKLDLNKDGFLSLKPIPMYEIYLFFWLTTVCCVLCYFLSPNCQCWVQCRLWTYKHWIGIQGGALASAKAGEQGLSSSKVSSCWLHCFFHISGISSLRKIPPMETIQQKIVSTKTPA